MAGFLSFLRDGPLANILTGRGTSVDRTTHNFWHNALITPDQIEAAYRNSWLIRQVVDIPADDQTRAGRDWDGDKEAIEKIEAEEKRLRYWHVVRQALIYGRLGGGAIFINLGDDPRRPLPANIRPQQIVSLVPLHRQHITIGQMDDDLLSPFFGEPVDFRVNTSAQPEIHRTRLVIFKGRLAPGIHMTSWQDRFWGDAIVQTVNDAVQNATTATSCFAALIDEAKVDVFTFAGMVEQLSQPGGEAKFMERLQVTATGKSLHRMVALGEGDTWEQRQINWAGMPDVIKTYLSIVAGAADIPATRLLGKSPDGMNSTGASDLTNYFQSVSAQQESDLRPALEKLDMAVLPSARASNDLTWSFSPLMVSTEKESAEIEKIEAETVTHYVNAGLIPESALAKSVQNRLIESQRFPGLQEAIEEAERAGEGLPEDETDLDIVPIPEGAKGGGQQSRAQGGPIGSEPPRRAANDSWFFADAAAKPLYVQRKLLNAEDLIAWAKTQGFETALPADDMHVTVIYSRAAVDPMKMGETWSSEEDGGLRVKPGGPRAVEKLGENAVVLLFSSWALSSRHAEMVAAGASHDWPDYQPHVTLSYSVPEGVDLDAIKPFMGELRFGPEIFEQLGLDWKSKIEEA